MDELAEEHRRCDALLAAVEQALERSEWGAFRFRLAELRERLLAHFACEEEDVFPAFERDGGGRELTAELGLQHRRMREILDTLGAVSPAHDPEGCRAELDAFASFLRQHKDREQALLYPVLHRLPAGISRRRAQAPAMPPLELRGLEPPQPIIRILDALERAPEEPLRVVLPHEPHPLYDLLRQRGFEWSGAPRADGGFELTIRKTGRD